MTNYLDKGAVVNGKPARMARYFTQTMNTPGTVGVVATFGQDGHWRAYIGAADGLANYEQAAEQIASWGVRLTEADARHFFPDVVLPYAEDSGLMTEVTLCACGRFAVAYGFCRRCWIALPVTERSAAIRAAHPEIRPPNRRLEWRAL